MSVISHFKDRASAGTALSKILSKYSSSNSVVLGIPRGGIVTAAVVAKELSLPLGLVIVRKIGHPYNSEFAIGAISESGSIILDKEGIRNIDTTWINKESEIQLLEAKRRRKTYWGNRSSLDLNDKNIILIDDGLATGLTMKMAIKEVKNSQVNKIVVAVPVGPKDTIISIRKEVNELISLIIPDYFAGSVGAYYDEFSQVNDEEVIKIINSFKNN